MSTYLCVTGNKECEKLAKRSLYNLFLNTYVKCVDNRGDTEEYWLRNHPGSKETTCMFFLYIHRWFLIGMHYQTQVLGSWYKIPEEDLNFPWYFSIQSEDQLLPKTQAALI